MHGASGIKASWDKWCGMDVRVGSFFLPSLSGLYFLIGLWYIYLPPVLVPEYFLTYRFQAIAVHTFFVLVLRWNPPKFASKAMVIGVWVLTAVIVGIPNAVHKNQHYYGQSGYCKSTSKFLDESLKQKLFTCRVLDHRTFPNRNDHNGIPLGLGSGRRHDRPVHHNVCCHAWLVYH